jgi:hypothetical protein
MTFESGIAGKFKNNPKLLYNYISERKTVKTQIRALTNNKGEIINDQYEIAKELNKYFHSVYIEDKDTETRIKSNEPENQNGTIL